MSWSTRSRSGSTASLQRQAQLPLRSPASFVLAVVGHRGSGKSTVIRKGLKQYGLSRPNSLSEKVTSYSTFCLVDHSERTIEVLEIDAAVLLNGPTKRFSWPKFLPSIDAVILCYDASEVSSFRSMSELLENFSIHGVRTVMLACKSDVEPKALNPYYASEMAAMYNVGLAECTSHTEEGRKRMRNCFSYLVMGVAKARAGKGSRSHSLRGSGQAAVAESDGTGTDGSGPSMVAQPKSLLGMTSEMGRARGHSLPNARYPVGNRFPAEGMAARYGSNNNNDGCRLARDPYHRCSARCCAANRKLSNATTTNESEPLSMSNSEDEASSDQRHQSMVRNAELRLLQPKIQGTYVPVDELFDDFFFSAVSKKDPAFATTFMIFYRGFAKPIDLLMQAITRFEVLCEQEKTDEEVIRYSLIRMATMLREWVHEYPGDLSGPDTYPVLMNFYHRLLEHRHCADVVRAAEPAFLAVADAPDLDAAWSARLDSHKPSSVAADYPVLNADMNPGSAMASPASVSGSGGGDSSNHSTLLPSLDVSVAMPSNVDGRPRADSGSVLASPSSLADSHSSTTDMSRLTASSAVVGRDRSLSNATAASFDRQPSLASSESSSGLWGPSPGTSSPGEFASNRAPTPAENARNQARIKAASDAILEMEVAQIGHELTIMAWSVFMDIKPRDLLRHALVPISQRLDGPCMQEIRHFNYISAWIVNMILAQSKVRNRTRMLEKFLTVAQWVRAEDDYATLYCIIGALESQSVFRLRNTWSGLPDKQVLKAYQSLIKLMNSSKSYGAYRMALQSSQDRTIPYLGVIYQDLVSLSAGNPSKDEQQEQVHWRKFELMREDLQTFVACQQYTGSVGQSDPAVQQHIMGLPILGVLDDALMERSKQLEQHAPRGRRTDEAWMSALSRKSKKLFSSSQIV